MQESGKDLRLILGLKLRNLRLARGEGLRQVAARAGLSVSYLSELEQGKKYPKPDKLLQLAGALDIDYDDLVSLKVADELSALKEAVSSGFLREFPFELFGVDREDLVRLIAESPDKTGPLIQSLVEIGRSYDVQVEHFLLSALRSYQQMHANYFEDLELAATEFRRTRKWPVGTPVEAQDLEDFLVAQWGFVIERESLADNPELNGFRSVFVPGSTPVIYLNQRLLPVQQAFILAREVGYRILGLEERVQTSSSIRIESFAQVLNNFRASYFAGALLMDRTTLEPALAELFALPVWHADRFLAIMARYRATPEMFLYRLTELVPQGFGLDKLFFMRFQRRGEESAVRLTKVFNLSGVPVPYGLGLKEHYCRRWPGVRMVASPAAGSGVLVERSRFLTQDVEFIVFSLGRSLALDPSTRSSVSIGFLLDRQCREILRFWQDPAILKIDVNLTCERCPLAAAECADRVAPPEIVWRQDRQHAREKALVALTEPS